MRSYETVVICGFLVLTIMVLWGHAREFGQLSKPTFPTKDIQHFQEAQNFQRALDEVSAACKKTPGTAHIIERFPAPTTRPL